MRQTQFRFFKNTPLIDFQNTIHFSNNQARDAFFLEGGHYDELTVENMDFNFVRDRSTIDLPVTYQQMAGVNYCTFLSDFEPSTRFYAYVIKYEYLNDLAVRVYLLIDGIMTYTQGSVFEMLPNVSIQRQHLTQLNYDQNIWELKNNNDILKTHTKSYFQTDKILFTDLLVLIKSSVDLKSDFGTVDDPKIKTSSGQQFDKITSPLNLYACDMSDFNALMEKLSNYAWISQNITSLSLIPKIFMEGNLTPMNFTSSESLDGVTYLQKVIGTFTNKNALIQELLGVSYTMEETLALFGLDPIQEKHLLRNEYTTSEVYNYSGGQLFIDNGQLNPARGLSYWCDIITGYHNEMKVFIDNYRNESNASYNGGAYVNDSLVFNQFDDIPMLINSFDLAMSKNANVRANAESTKLSNRFESVIAPDTKLKDRFMNAANMLSGFSMTDLFGKFKDEYDFYNQQKAEFADMALETPTITNQTTGNSFNIANQMFGIHFKYSKPSAAELNNIRKYYKLFGYALKEQSATLNRVDSMSIFNYVQFSGSWSIPFADVAIVEMMKAQFENGVRLWHNKNIPNPMVQNVLDNVMVR